MPPADYVCHNCHTAGHWRTNCPLQPKDKVADNSTSSKGVANGKGSGANGPSRKGSGGGSAKNSRAKNPLVPGSGYVCNMCQQPGHWISNCPLAPAERAVDRPPPPASYVCKKCNVAGHWIELCTIQSARRPAAASGVPPLVVCAESAEAGQEIGEALEEEEDEAVKTIQRVVAALGEDTARMLLVQTWQVEEQGGLLRLDGSGVRRTAGGVFLWLVKQQATPMQRTQIWPKTDEPAKSGGVSGSTGKRKKSQKAKLCGGLAQQIESLSDADIRSQAGTEMAFESVDATIASPSVV